MSWYYAENNERRGPVEEAAFQSLVSSGAIKPETLVWRDGLADWVPYSRAAAASASPVGVAGVAGSGAVACSQCNRMVPVDETVTYEGRYVCAACKPLFFQKVKEGALAGPGIGNREYGGFWIRFCGKFVDNIILKIVTTALTLVIGAAFADHREGGAFVIVLTTVWGVMAGYSIFFNGKYGATPGKMACKLEIVRSDGSPMTFGRATGRFFAEMLSGLTLGIGYIIAAFDEEKRALHDRICDTRVVRKTDR